MLTDAGFFYVHTLLYKLTTVNAITSIYSFEIENNQTALFATKFYEVRLFQIVRILINIEYTKTAIFYKTI